MHTPLTHSPEVRELRRYLRDLVALTALPAVRSEGDGQRMAESLADVLVKVLHLDFAYVQVKGLPGRGTIEVVRSEQQPDIRARARTIGSAIAPWLTHDKFDAGAVLSLSCPPASGPVQAAVTPIGHDGEFGVVVAAASAQPDFPTEEDRLLLGVVANQAAMVRQRWRAEHALRRSEQRFRLVAETSPSILWTAAPDGAITYANDRWFQYCGLTPEQNTRRWPELVLHPDDRQRCIEAWTRALQQGTEYEIELRNRRHDGVYRWFVTRAVPFRDAAGRIVQWYGSSTDIDDRKRAEQTARFLADASASLAELTDHESALQRIASLAVPVFADWCIVDTRQADGSLRRLSVAHFDSANVQLARELQRRYPPRPLDSRGIKKVLHTGAPHGARAPSNARRDSAPDDDHLRMLGELGFKSCICVPLRTRTMDLGVLTFITAESSRVYDADDLRAAEDLADRAAIAIENATLLRALREADKHKDEFLAMLAHELRNPLAPIQSAAQLLRAKGAPGPELEWARDVIDRQMRQLARLVDDLLDVARIRSGKMELRKEPVELALIVARAVEAGRPLIDKAGHELTITLPPEPILLEADPARLTQVLLNLLNNAAKYTDPGGRIWLTTERKDDGVLIRVKDTGIGIAADMLPRIFEMFTQADRSLERSQGGLGIGLMLAKRLVEMHGGTLHAHSEGAGKGSEFVVRLPLVVRSPTALDVRDRGPHDPGDRGNVTTTAARRILVVDDYKDAAESLAKLLRIMGHQVRTARDGLEAVETASAFQPEVVLMDLGLPKLNGYDAARRIRDERGGGVMLIALTGWGQDEDRRRSTEADFDHHLTKPVELDALQELIARL